MSLSIYLKDNALRIAWGLYNHEKRIGQPFNRDQFREYLRIGNREIKRRILFLNRKFSPVAKPLLWDETSWTGKVWDKDSKSWVDVQYERA